MWSYTSSTSPTNTRSSNSIHRLHRHQVHDRCPISKVYFKLFKSSNITTEICSLSSLSLPRLQSRSLRGGRRVGKGGREGGRKGGKEASSVGEGVAVSRLFSFVRE